MDTKAHLQQQPLQLSCMAPRLLPSGKEAFTANSPRQTQVLGVAAIFSDSMVNGLLLYIYRKEKARNKNSKIFLSCFKMCVCVEWGEVSLGLYPKPSVKMI